jgi:undecaprenyl-diphosphatase
MEPWQLIVSLIQGFLEWLPISSQGQAVLFLYNLEAIPAELAFSLAIWLHFGTATAVVVRYHRDIYQILRLADRTLLRHLLIATCATAVTAVPLYLVFRGISTSVEYMNAIVGAFLLVTGLALYLPLYQKTPGQTSTDEQVSDRRAAITGLIQGFSILPGLSRSGLTVATLLMFRVEKEAALKFSFLMSVPAVMGVIGLEVIVGGAPLAMISATDLLLMELAVFLSGLATMEFLLRFARRVSFWKLCLVLGILAVIGGLLALL